MAGPKGHRKHVRVREKPAPRYAPLAETKGLSGVLLDTDVVIEVLRGNRSLVALVVALADEGIPSYCTAVTWAEIFAGLRKGEEMVTESFLAARGEVIIDAGTGRHAGAYLARYGRSHGVEIGDALIAAAAATTGFHLWTLNRKHFPMPDVRLFEPATS